MARPTGQFYNQAAECFLLISRNPQNIGDEILAERLGVSKRQVNKYLQLLSCLKLISRSTSKLPDGKGKWISKRKIKILEPLLFLEGKDLLEMKNALKLKESSSKEEQQMGEILSSEIRKTVKRFATLSKNDVLQGNAEQLELPLKQVSEVLNALRESEGCREGSTSSR